MTFIPCIGHKTEPMEARDGIVFQSDFSVNTGYSVDTVNGWNREQTVPPEGWTAVRVGPFDGRLSVASGEGMNGSNALKLEYASGNRAVCQLAKHLTGDVSTGHDDLYIRYNIKLPDNFKAGTDTNSIPFWKWGRLWQNTTPQVGDSWSEKRADSGYVVWGLNPVSSGQSWYGVFADNLSPTGRPELGSDGGPYQLARWRYPGATGPTSDGHFESVGNGAWAFDPANPRFLLDRDQTYHTLEWRFKLSSSAGAEDGNYEMWIDGVKQADFNELRAAFEAPVRSGIPTVADTSGFNHFSLFDNLQGWTEDWDKEGIDGFVLISDVVVCTSRIGHDYVANGLIDNTGT